MKAVGRLPAWPTHPSSQPVIFAPWGQTTIRFLRYTIAAEPESFFDGAVRQHPELHGPPAYFTWNSEIAAGSILGLAAMQPNILAPGHGHPLACDDLSARITTFASFCWVSASFA